MNEHTPGECLEGASQPTRKGRRLQRVVAQEQPPVRRRTAYERLVKPAMDTVLGSALLVALLPLLGVIAVAVAGSIGRPVLFRQRRVGQHGRVFVVFKFRTMQHDRRLVQRAVERERRLTHKSVGDPRHTPIGRFLRKASLDELPQLINVLRGEMSLVGPRPELPQIVERYESWGHRRHEVRPGMTGLWQVTARGQGLMHERLDLDLRYVDEISLRTDLRILARTLPAVLRDRAGH